MLPKLPSEAQRHEDRRKCGRLLKATVQCSMGTVLDVSGQGLRIAGTGLTCPSSGQLRTLSLGSGAGMVELSAKVVWSRKLGLFKWQAGLQFLNLTPQLQNDIGSLLGLGRCAFEPITRAEKPAFAA